MSAVHTSLTSLTICAGLGLAVVARIVEQLGGQLRVDSALDQGSRFSFLLPLTTEMSIAGGGRLTISGQNSSNSSLVRSMRSGNSGSESRGSEIDNLVDALASSHIPVEDKSRMVESRPASEGGKVGIPGSARPLKPVKMDQFDLDRPVSHPKSPRARISAGKSSPLVRTPSGSHHVPKLRILVVEVGIDAYMHTRSWLSTAPVTG